MLLCLLLPTLAAIWAMREPSPRWRASYFDEAGPGGELAPTLVREERDVNPHDYHWTDPGSLVDIPDERPSVVWESCLTLERAQRVAFQLTSHDHARLTIDGRPVIDNSGRRPLPRTEGVDVSLTAGLHPVRVEYEERAKSAALTLTASFDGKRPQRIAPERLRLPGESPGDPCGSGAGR
jgi:hypothetical protein